MGNPALRRALAVLAHPVTIAAVLLMLVNDHVFKHLVPGWWTGKLSDLAWVVFAPFLLAVPLAIAIPSRLRRQDRVVIGLALAATGIGYALFNLNDPFHDLSQRVLGWAVGWEVYSHRDPTDAMSILGLWVPWRLWVTQRPAARFVRSTGVSVAVLAGLATMATTLALRDYGIVCLAAEGDALIATSVGLSDRDVSTSFTSHDGGVTWAPAVAKPCTIREGPFDIADPRNPGTIYRFLPGHAIERSGGAGTPWQREVDLSKLGHESTVLYYEDLLERPDSVVVRPGPLDAIVHAQTGNLVVAMGHDGVLVRPQDGAWRWIPVGPYGHEPPSPGDRLALLSDEKWMAFVLFALAFVTLLIPGDATARRRLELVLIAWILWTVGTAFLPPGRGELCAVPLAVSALVLAVAVGCRQVFKRDLRDIAVRVLIAVLVAALFLFPYVLWSQALIPHHRQAGMFSLALTLPSIVAAWWYFREKDGVDAIPPPAHPAVKSGTESASLRPADQAPRDGDVLR